MYLEISKWSIEKVVLICRAKFITGSVAMLLQKPEGGDEWLRSLRQIPYREAVEALISLPGIGPKACLQHFSSVSYQDLTFHFFIPKRHPILRREDTFTGLLLNYNMR